MISLLTVLFSTSVFPQYFQKLVTHEQAITLWAYDSGTLCMSGILINHM